MTLEELVGLLAPKLPETNRSCAYVRDKVRKRLRYAIEHGELSSPSSDGRYELGTIAAWAECQWPGKDFALPRTIVERVEDKGAANDLCAAHVAATSLDTANNALASTAMAMAMLQSENTTLRSKATKYDRYVATCRKNAEQKRPRNY